MALKRPRLPGQIHTGIGLFEQPAQRPFLGQPIARSQCRKLHLVLRHRPCRQTVVHQRLQLLREMGRFFRWLDMHINPRLTTAGHSKTGFRTMHGANVHHRLWVIGFQHCTQPKQHAQQVKNRIMLRAGL